MGVLGGAGEHFDVLCLHGCRAGSEDLAGKRETHWLRLQGTGLSKDFGFVHVEGNTDFPSARNAAL